MEDNLVTKFLTIEEVAIELRITYEAVRQLIKRGLLPAIRVGHLYRIPREQYNNFLSKSEV